MEPYQYAAIVLREVDMQEAIRITKKGIAANPTAWRLYHLLGYIYWRKGEFQTAGELYDQGAAQPGAPRWMEAMKARMASEGGSRNLAREIYTRMYEEPGDSNVKEMARLRLMQLDSLDERDAIRRVLDPLPVQSQPMSVILARNPTGLALFTPALGSRRRASGSVGQTIYSGQREL